MSVFAIWVCLFLPNISEKLKYVCVCVCVCVCALVCHKIKDFFFIRSREPYAVIAGPHIWVCVCMCIQYILIQVCVFCIHQKSVYNKSVLVFTQQKSENSLLGDGRGTIQEKKTQWSTLNALIRSKKSSCGWAGTRATIVHVNTQKEKPFVQCLW
jgi:hypothetical protein